MPWFVYTLSLALSLLLFVSLSLSLICPRYIYINKGKAGSLPLRSFSLLPANQGSVPHLLAAALFRPLEQDK